MTKKKLFLVTLLLVLGFGVMVPSAMAQAVLTATVTAVNTLRPNSNAEAVGGIILTYASGAGTMLAGQSISVTFSAPIAGAAGVASLTAAQAQGYFCASTMLSTPCSALTITAAGATLTLTTATAQAAGFLGAGYIKIWGVRITTVGSAPGSSVTAIISTNDELTNPITFSNNLSNVFQIVVGTVSSVTALTQSTVPPTSFTPGTIYTCLTVPSAGDSPINVADTAVYFDAVATENWVGAWTSKDDENALAPYLVTNGVIVTITVTGIPLGLTVTAPTVAGLTLTNITGAQTWGSPTPASYTGLKANDTAVFQFPITATARVAPFVPESSDFRFYLTSTGALPPNNVPMAFSVTLGPAVSGTTYYPAFSYPVFGMNEESPGTPLIVIDFVDCTTQLLFPYVTNYNGGAALGPLGNWDTALEIANATSIPLTFPFSTPPQNGTCTFYFYSAGTASTIGTATQATPAVTYTTPFILSGGNYSFMVSSQAPGLLGGYAWVNCNFLYAAGYAELVDNANGLGNWQVMAGYLAIDPKKK
jgi:hypothetical protein